MEGWLIGKGGAPIHVRSGVQNAVGFEPDKSESWI